VGDKFIFIFFLKRTLLSTIRGNAPDPLFPIFLFLETHIIYM
jgi:hypothetical protein